MVGNVAQVLASPRMVYNLEVAEGHTYFVEDGQSAQTPVWVHNECALKLAANLLAAKKQKLAGEIAHHVVARFSRFAERTREMLRSVGITQEMLDDAFNGVFLPANKAIAAATKSAKAIHSTIHTKAKYKKIEELIESVLECGSDAAKAKVREIAEMMANNTF